MKFSNESIPTGHPNPFASVETADGVRLRYGMWRNDAETCAGTVLVAGGRSEFMEKYFETIEELLSRGYQVFSFDWRGQGLSQRMLDDSEKGFIQTYEQYLLDLDAMLRHVVYPLSRPPLIVLAHSMGGHVALRYAAEREHRLDRLVLTAPMINIHTGPLPVAMMRRVSQTMVRWGFAQCAVVGSGRHNPFREPFVKNRLTSDSLRFERTLEQVRENPALSAAKVTYGWLAATFDSIDILTEESAAHALDIPVLIMAAGNDRVVCNAAIERFAGKQEHCRIIGIPHAGHEILQEQDHLRSQFWRAFDAFKAC